MISKGFGTPIEEIEAQLQSRVGEFLGEKAKLNTMVNSSDLTIRDQAATLLSNQKVLEDELANTLLLIQKVKTDAYAYSDFLTAGVFYAEMEKHIYDVNSLWSEYSGISTGSILENKWLWIVGAGALFLYFRYKK